ncbi:MAG: MoxR family ATPase [Defluviitaleaceae bacterium]|nr:MoxR family ATPase [Defluviitaleaceae bacterium]
MLKNITQSIKSQVGDYVFNQDVITELALASFFAGGHILLASPTGLGKSSWAQAFAKALGLSYDCVRFSETNTPGRAFINYASDSEGNLLAPQPGALFSPVFHAEFYEDDTDSRHTQLHMFKNTHSWVHMHMIDAIDRNNKNLTDDNALPFLLPDPHFIIASCNDTRILPAALTDRFMMKLYVNYPGVAAEKQMLQMHHVNTAHEPQPQPVPVCTPETISQAKQEVQAVAVDDVIFNYIIGITETTRRANAVQIGASPRASISLLMAAKAYAAIAGRDYVTIGDVQGLAIPVLRHRIILRPDAIKEGINADRIIESIIVSKG